LHIRVEVSGFLKIEASPFLQKDKQPQNSVMFATSQLEKCLFGQAQICASESESKPKALTQQFLQVTLPFIFCYRKGMLLCPEAQSPDSVWTPANCSFTCCDLALSTPALGFQESPALLLSHRKILVCSAIPSD